MCNNTITNREKTNMHINTFLINLTHINVNTQTNITSHRILFDVYNGDIIYL